MTSVDRSVLERPAVEVAPLLLGCVIRHREVAVRITETEAYEGELDPGSHAFRGRTARNAVMFGEPGRLYAYFTYGMHTCANVVCSPPGTAGAVLLRAGEVVEGADAARARRTTSKSDADLARGPARLVVALGLGLADNGADLVPADLQPGGPVLEQGAPAMGISSGPRTGVSGDGGSIRYPWRYWITGDATVSPYRASTPRRRARPPAR